MTTHTPTIREDLHTHSTWSDGRGTLEDNLAEAERLGLTRLGMVDHVRHDTTWVPDFVLAVDALRAQTAVTLVCGVESRMLNVRGDLDLPDDLHGVDRVYIADHRLPLGNRCLTPKEVRTLQRADVVSQTELVNSLVQASVNSMQRCPRPAVLAHWGSILPKVDIDPDVVTDRQLDQLARAAIDSDTWIEADERWKAASITTLCRLADRGVTIVYSSDAHRTHHIGQYTWATTVHEALAGVCGC